MVLLQDCVDGPDLEVELADEQFGIVHGLAAFGAVGQILDGRLTVAKCGGGFAPHQLDADGVVVSLAQLPLHAALPEVIIILLLEGLCGVLSFGHESGRILGRLHARQSGQGFLRNE